MKGIVWSLPQKFSTKVSLYVDVLSYILSLGREGCYAQLLVSSENK
jgi:hypothetical protein